MNASDTGSTTRSTQRITSNPSTASTAWKTARQSAIGTRRRCVPVIASTSAWMPSAPVSAWAANQYVAATTR